MRMSETNKKGRTERKAAYQGLDELPILALLSGHHNLRL
jgi:hypothetical protein